MAAGHIVGGQCVPVAFSNAVYFSSFRPDSYFDGVNNFLTTFNYNGTNMVIRVEKNGESFLSFPVVPRGFISCDTNTFLYPGLPEDFDYSILGAVFAFAISVVVAMYVLGRGAGVVLSIFRR